MPQLRFFILLFVLFAPTVDAKVISGVVEKVKDADTLVINGELMRLYGIDAPELNQSCIGTDGRSYACGETAARVLTKLVLGKRVICTTYDRDKYQRLLGICRRGVVNINQYLVAQGWAVAYTRFDRRFVAAQKMAERRGVGLWQGDFDMPEVFRRANADSVASPIRYPEADSQRCKIKGNINAKGQRIYHTPWGSKNYSRTRISEKKGERWFCSESEARAAGWRAPRGG